MDKLKGLLSLPFSRKFIAAVLVPVLFALNRKLALGFSDAEVLGVAAAMVAFIVGTAMEDAKKNGNGKPVASLLLPLLLLVGLTGGCCSKDIKVEVRALHKAHQTWRQNTAPKPDLSDADKKKVDELGAKMEESFNKLETLTE